MVPIPGLMVDAVMQDFLSIADFEIRIARLDRNFEGICDSRKKLIQISKDLLDDPKALKATLLHEMIHAYIGKLRPCGYDYPVYQYLYERLLKRLGSRKFSELITLLGHHGSFAQAGVSEQGMSLRQICQFLTQMEVPTKWRGKGWHPEMVKRILAAYKSTASTNLLPLATPSTTDDIDPVG